MRVKSTTTLRLREIKTGNIIGYIFKDETVEVITRDVAAKARIAFAKAHNNENVWIEVRKDDGQEGICSAYYVEEPVLHSKFLVGLHGPSDPDYWPWPAAYGAIMTGKIEAVKLLTPGHSSQVVNQLKAIPNVEFIMARMFAKFEHPKSAEQFANEVSSGVDDLYKAGVRYFEIHNEPNLHIPNSNPEGMWINWNNGADFARWFIKVYRIFKDRYGNDIKLGFPGLSPGAYYVHNGMPARANSEEFITQAKEAVNLSDWLGMHIYWGNGLPTQYAINEIAKFCAQYPDKEILITEISNSDSSIPPTLKGEEYKWLVKQQMPPNLKALFFYTASASSDPRREKWVGTQIPEIIGNR